MRMLFLFLDGVGLGSADPAANPFARAQLPTLTRFTNSLLWTDQTPQVETQHGVFIPTDACLGVPGRPQSATGQASILTGRNIPQLLGLHYGPKPNPEIAETIMAGNIIRDLVADGLTVNAANAYPDEFFIQIDNGRRLRSANQLALHSAGVGLPGVKEFYEHKALSADFTGEGWHSVLKYDDAPLYTPREAGRLLGKLTSTVDLLFFDNWVTDYIGHRGTMEQAVSALETLDSVLAGLLDVWDCEKDLILITSDHGNIEDINSRRHTVNPVPTLIVGSPAHRRHCADISNLTDIARFIHSAFH